MKMKGNDTITANKKADGSDRTCEEEEEPSPYMHFPFALEVI
jgi:hypothetical protein